MRITVATGLVLLTIGCSKGASTPTSPSGPTAPPPVTSVTVTLTRDLMNLGDSQTATVSPSVAGTWSIEPAALASASQDGRITGNASGRGKVIFVTSAGVRGEADLRVVPAYSGTWAGFHVVERCAQTEGLADENICGDVPPNRDYPIDARFQQSGALVTGTLRLGELPRSVEVTVPIADDGAITIATHIVFGSSTFQLSQVRLNTADGRTLTGTMSQRFTDTQTTGEVRIESVIRTMQRQ